MTRVVSTNTGPGGRFHIDPFIHLGFRGFWLTSAIRQLFDLQVRSKSYLVRGMF